MGHGCLLKHDELKGWLCLKEPVSVPEYKKYALEYMYSLDKLRQELLYEHDMYLKNIHGEGYQVMIPDEQVDIAPDIHTKKARRELRKAADALIHVDAALLSIDASKTRLQKMERVAFLKSAFNERKVYKIEKTEQIQG